MLYYRAASALSAASCASAYRIASLPGSGSARSLAPPTKGHALCAPLDEELLDGVLQLLDLVLELRALVGGHGGGDHRPRHAARAAKRLLVRDEDVWHVLRAAGAVAQGW